MNNLNYSKIELYKIDFVYNNFNFSIIFQAPILKIFICDIHGSYLDFVQYDILKNSLVAPTQSIERKFQRKIYESLTYIKNFLIISFIETSGL